MTERPPSFWTVGVSPLDTEDLWQATRLLVNYRISHGPRR
jgi:hypothetical protein